MSIVSVCRILPNPADSSSGIFVLRRLSALAEQVSLTAVQPIPSFPLVAPVPAWARTKTRIDAGVSIVHAPMFYVPKFFKSLDGFWLYRSLLPRLIELTKQAPVSLLDAHFAYPDGVGAVMAAKKLGIPAVVTLRGNEAEYLDDRLIGRQLRRLLRKVDGCICVSHFLRRLAIENGCDPKKSTVIQNAIDRNAFFPGNQAEARSKLGLSESKAVVVSIGHVIPRKQHHVLVAAFAELLKDRPETRLLIIGDKSFEPAYVRQVERQIAGLGIGNAVQLLGNVEVALVPDYLRAADVFALGTQREGCCNAVIEALACGIPVVTTPVGDNAWFVEDGENGHIVPLNDVPAMASALQKAVTGRDWDNAAISGNLKVGSWHTVATETARFFEKVVEAYSGTRTAYD